MSVLPSAETRAWIVATVWASFYRDRPDRADDLLRVLRADASAQTIVLKALPDLPGCSASAALHAVDGVKLEEVLREAHFGGVHHVALSGAAPADCRATGRLSADGHTSAPADRPTREFGTTFRVRGLYGRRLEQASLAVCAVARIAMR